MRAQTQHFRIKHEKLKILYLNLCFKIFEFKFEFDFEILYLYTLLIKNKKIMFKNQKKSDFVREMENERKDKIYDTTFCEKFKILKT